MDKSCIQLINGTGLLFNAIGAALLIFFTSPGLDVTEAGASLARWTTGKPEDQMSEEEKRVAAANRRKFRKHKCGFKTGVILLVVGYALQLTGVVLAALS